MEPGLHWKVAEGQGEGTGDHGEGTSSWARVVSHVGCPGLALMARGCWCLLQGILSHCSQEGS